MLRASLMAAAFAGLGAALGAAPAQAFCGFYVAKADTRLFNKASKVIVARKGQRTVVTMASDYSGDPKEFALVIPVPTVVTKEMIHITENALVDHVDAYSAPRLVEYHDPDPCAVQRPMMVSAAAKVAGEAAPGMARRDRANSLGVKIEAEYTVGEYDILILSAKESDGLATWLAESGYKIPQGAAPVLGSYIKQGMKFFVARVNLKEQAKRGSQFLRPIQVAYETHKFMLPIRLGTVNADGPQEMFVFMLTEKGRVETTNYRTIRIPSDKNVPIFTKAEFPQFYRAMFDRQVKTDGMRAVYLEYAWNMGWCDPCAADPIPNDKLVELGAFWLADAGGPQPSAGTGATQPRVKPMPPGRAQNVFITRLHVRYDAANFPEDLMFQETADSSNFQGRYVLHHPFTGEASCPAGDAYRQQLAQRYEQEAQNLSNLTGWEIGEIRAKMAEAGQKAAPTSSPGGGPDGGDKAWIQKMWGRGSSK